MPKIHDTDVRDSGDNSNRKRIDNVSIHIDNDNDDHDGMVVIIALVSDCYE